MPEKTTPPTAPAESQRGNRDIEGFLSVNECLEIEAEYGFRELNKYLQDLALVQMGVQFSDLGISKRREEKQARVITFNEAGASGQEPGTYSFTSWRELYKNGDIPPGSIALLSLSGVMRSESSMSTPGMDSVIEDLRNAYNHPNVRGVIIETNSGGGESLAGTMLKSAIQERNKPVVGFGHLVASAAYRALSGADEIISSSEYSEFGSIGTMVTLDSDFLNKYRSRFSDFYGSGASGKNFEFRQALAGNFTPLQMRVDELTGKFQQEIIRDRPLRGDTSVIAESVSGKVFDGAQAKRRGLVDGIGTMQYAVRRVRSLSKKY